MDTKVTRLNRDIQLAASLGYECGIGERVEYQFPSRDKAWNDCWPLIKDIAREKGWMLGSKDALERWFYEGYGRGIEAKRAKENHD